MPEIRDEFLSEEDLDLKNLTKDELYAWWNEWLRQAQATNERDAYEYSHGTFVLVREPHDESGSRDTSCASATPSTTIVIPQGV